MDDADWRLYVRDRSSQTPVGGEFGYNEHGAVEAQGSAGLPVDPIDAIKKYGVQHHQGEDNIRSVEGTEIGGN